MVLTNKLVFRERRWISAFVVGVFTLLALALFVAAFLHYETLKSLTASLTSDGNFNSLKAENAIIFKALFIAGGLFFLIVAALTAFRHWNLVGSFFKQLLSDSKTFFRSLCPSKKEWGYLTTVLLITLLAVVYRLEYIYSSLHHDEAYTIVAFSRSLWTAMTDYHLPNNHVFHSVLVYLSTRVFGIQPWAVRFPAFTAGVLLVPATYGLGKRLYDRWTGLAAALLVALAPALIGYSDNARGYTLVALFTLLLLGLGDFVRTNKNTFAWSLVSLLSALGMYTVPVMLFPFGVLYVWLFLENLVECPGPYRSRWDFLRYWLASGLGAAFLTLLFYVPILVYTGPAKLFANVFVSPLPWSDLLETLASRFGETWAEWTFRVPLTVIVLLAAGWTLSLILHQKLSTRRVPVQVAAALWIVALLIIQRPNAWSKVWVFLQPLMLLWAAAGIIGLLRLIRVKTVSLATVAVILAIGWGLWRALWLVPQLPELWDIHGEEESVVLYIQSHLMDGDKVAFAPPDDTPVWYYAELYGISNAMYNQDTSFSRLLVLVDPAEGQTVETVITSRGPDIGSVDLESCNLFDTFGKIQVYECSSR